MVTFSKVQIGPNEMEEFKKDFLTTFVLLFDKYVHLKKKKFKTSTCSDMRVFVLRNAQPKGTKTTPGFSHPNLKNKVCPCFICATQFRIAIVHPLQKLPKTAAATTRNLLKKNRFVAFQPPPSCPRMKIHSKLSRFDRLLKVAIVQPGKIHLNQTSFFVGNPWFHFLFFV